MAKAIINGEVVSGSTSYASAVEYTKKDGTKSTVQNELDELNTNLTNENNESFNFGVLNGVRGLFHRPFKS